MVLEGKWGYGNLHVLQSVFTLVTFVVGWSAIHITLYTAHSHV